MSEFPRTSIGGLSVSRMVIGTNWLLGFSHTTNAKDVFIKEYFTERKRIADILTVFMKAGVDLLIGDTTRPFMTDAIKDAEDKSGRRMNVAAIPNFTTTPDTPAKGLDLDEASRMLDELAKMPHVKICMPHQCTTDNLVDRCTRKIRHIDTLTKMIRERGMIPGLSTHMPETIIYADENKADVETYISIYNSMGFLMQVEVDWVQRVILSAKKPVLTIKPLAAGQLRPLQGLTFVWNTIRDQDLVAIGTMTPLEAQEVIDISLACLEHRTATIKLQETRSKASVKTKTS